MTISWKLRSPVATIAAMLLATSAMSEPEAAPFMVIPTSLEGLRPCNGDAASVAATVRIMIPANLDTTVRGARWVRWQAGDNQDEDDKEQFKNSKVNESKKPKSDKDPFHIYLKEMGGATTSEKWIRVRVVLKNEDYKFWTGEDPNNKPIQGIGSDYIQEPQGRDDLCQKPNETNVLNKNSKNVTTFYVRWRNQKQSYSVNFIIVSNTGDGEETPIMIDPKIKNEG